jgi:hypothetical protein
MRYSTCSTELNRVAHSSRAGNWNGTPELWMRCLARLIRCAIVDSGTRNADAISAVVRPPTARSVRAIAELGVSAGWQHRNSSSRVSSWSTTDGGVPVSSSPVSSSRRRRASSLRQMLIRRRAATVTNHASGLSGTPFTGQSRAAASSASWTASSALSKSR